MSDRKVIGYKPIYAPQRGAIVTHAFIHCSLCGAAISAVNGPVSDAVCLSCSEGTDEIERLRKLLSGRARWQEIERLERDADSLIKKRDDVTEMADKLADAISMLTGVDIGEHSSGNCPWEAALEAADAAMAASTVTESVGDDNAS